MKNLNEQQSLKPSTLKAAIFVLLLMLWPMKQAQSQGPPTGPAGGDLAGTYPNPTLAADRVRKTGDTMSGTLNISMASGAGTGSTFSLSGFGNMGPDRGVAFLFNLPTSAAGSALGAHMVAARETFGLPSYLSFSTHNGTAVTEALRITSTGNVGIGTPSPGLRLDVRGTSIILGTGARALIGNYDMTPMAQGVGGGLQFGGKSDTNGTVAGFASISGIKENGTDSDFSSALVFTTRAYPQTQTERMRISSIGKVGIGTTNPQSNLQIGTQTSGATASPATLSLGGTFSSSAGANLKLKFYDDGTTTNTYGIGVSSGSMDFGVSPTGGYNWYSGGAHKMVLTGGGSVGIGLANPNLAYKLDVNGPTNVTGNLNATGTITGGTINAKYQDMAEWVESSQTLPAGTVVVLDHTKSNQVVASTEAYDTRVAGVISAQPGITLGESGEAKVLVATTGRVRIKVDATSAPIQVGDLLVTGDRAGFAMKSLPVNIGGVQLHRPGTLVGKALEPLAKGTGEILVLLSLQ